MLTEEVYGLFGLEAEEPLQKLRVSQRRSHLEIKMDILSCVRAGVDKPTQVMYKANLSWTALQEHLGDLEGNGLLRATDHGNRKRLEVTEKALSVLMAYKKVLEDIRAPTEKKRVVY